MTTLWLALAAALLSGAADAVGNGPYMGGISFRSTQTPQANLRFTGQGAYGNNASASTVLTVLSDGGTLNVTQQTYYNHVNLTLTHIHVAWANSTATPRGVLQLINTPVVTIFQNISGVSFLTPADSMPGQNGMLTQIVANSFLAPLEGLPLECLLDCCTVVTQANGGCCPDSGTVVGTYNPTGAKGLPLVGCYVGNHVGPTKTEFSSGWLQVVG